MGKKIRKRLLWAMNWWPPLLGAGIRVRRMTDDLREIDVEMKLRFWNANYVGTHFGGSLFTMTDPFYMLMLVENLGREYIVWDKTATIRFRKPGRGTVRAEFRLTHDRIGEIRSALESAEKYEPVFRIEVKDAQGDVVAEVEKVIHVRRK